MKYFFYLCNVECKLQNVSRGEKSKQTKVEIKTQNEKIVETDNDIRH